MRILIFSPIATHPQNAGHRSRIFYLVNTLKNWGHDVYFVYLQSTFLQADFGKIEAMIEYFGVDRFKILENSELKMLRQTKELSEILRLETIDVDEWFDDSLEREIVSIENEFSPDIVFVEYPTISKIFEYLRRNSLKIIDTIDIFTNRNKLMWDHEIYYEKPQPSFTIQEEEKAIKRADIIIAIQNKEEMFYRHLVSKPIFHVGHLAPLMKNREVFPDKPTILYIGSGGSINRKALGYFIKNIFPEVQENIPDVKLFISGDISAHISINNNAIFKYGYISDLQKMYNATCVSINSDLFATGLSIKSITSLSYCTPLITSTAGMRGIEEANNFAFYQAESSDDFSRLLTKILADKEQLRILSRNAYQFYYSYLESNLQNLTKAIS